MQSGEMINCYIINLDSSPERWKSIEQCEGFRNLNVIRVSGVNGAEIQLPHPDFSDWKYFLFYGRRPTKGEIGCYFSHINVMKIFLESKQTHCIICEDDIQPVSDFADIVASALKYSDTWEILRLHNSRHLTIPYTDLGNGYKLATPLSAGSLTSAYMINRTAAKKILSRCLPMWKPIDTILFNDVPFLRESIVYPFPIKLSDTAKQSDLIKINNNTNQLRGKIGRYPFPYPAVCCFLTVLLWRVYSRTVRYLYNYSTAILRRIAPPRQR
jgi:glycosyl transferase family 25